MTLLTKVLRRHALLAALAILAVLFIPASKIDAAEKPITLAEYRQLLAHTRETLDGLPDSSPEAVQPTLEELALEWEAITQVEMEDGQVIQVQHAYLATKLRSNPHHLERLAGLVTELENTMASWPQDTVPADAHSSLQGILARREFQWQDKPTSILGTLLERFWQAIDRLFNQFVDPVLNVDANKGVIWVCGGAITLGLVAILVYTLRGTLGRLVGDADVTEEGRTDDEGLTAAAAIKRAQKLSEAGDFRTAVRYLYISSLLLLEERGILRYNRSLTNREVLHSVASQPALAEPLKDVVDVFDQVWYGYHTLDEEALKEYTARVNELHQKP